MNKNIKVTDLPSVLNDTDLNDLEYQAERIWSQMGGDIKKIMLDLAEMLYPDEMAKLTDMKSKNLTKTQTEQRYNKIMNNTDTTSAVFAPVTNWISKADAQAKRKELIASGLDKKQVKLSSYRWADLKDHSKGYICRVLVVKGLCPEMEAEVVIKRKAKSTKAVVTTCESGNSVEGEVKYASATDWTATA